MNNYLKLNLESVDSLNLEDYFNSFLIKAEKKLQTLTVRIVTANMDLHKNPKNLNALHTKLDSVKEIHFIRGQVFALNVFLKITDLRVKESFDNLDNTLNLIQTFDEDD